MGLNFKIIPRIFYFLIFLLLLSFYMPWSTSWCLTFAFLPCRFTLHGLFLKGDAVPYTALYPVAHLWFPGLAEDNVNKDTKHFSRALPDLSALCGQAEPSLQPEKSCKTQLSMWNFAWMWLKMLVQTLRRSELDLRAPFFLWGRNAVVHHSPVSPAVSWRAQFHCWLKAASGLALLGWPGGSSAHCLWQGPRAKASRRAQKQRGADSNCFPSPGMPQGGISELPPPRPLCLPVSIPPE